MLSRRDIGVLSASGLACSYLGMSGCEAAPERIWQGEALGAPSFIKLYGLSATNVKRIFAAAEMEILRLGDIFSLYNPASEISTLNRDGVLEHASSEMVEVLQAARKISNLTDGAFDITVQSLWNTANFLNNSQETKQDHQPIWANAYSLVDYRYVVVKERRVSFAKPGVTITLNALAQGYITDKITQLLVAANAQAGLVNIGEFRAFGPKTWKLGVQDPRNVMDIIDVIALKNAGLATSSAMGGYLSEELSHIFSPRTGHDKPQFISASVVHPSAMMADGFATAFTLLDVDKIRKIAKTSEVQSGLLLRESGEITRL